MKELVRYLLDNMFIDFQGTIDIDHVREYLRKDDSRESRSLLNKLNNEGGVDDMLETLSDTLRQNVARGVNDQTMREQLTEYAES